MDLSRIPKDAILLQQNASRDFFQFCTQINGRHSFAAMHMHRRVRPRLDMKPRTYASSGNKHFSLNLVILRLINIMNRGNKNWAQS